IAKTFELGGGNSPRVILRRTPGASLFQSPSAALPLRNMPLSAAIAVGTAISKPAAMNIAKEKNQTVVRFLIHVSNRFGPKDHVDQRMFLTFWGAQAASL